jgi:hypothetical protein
LWRLHRAAFFDLLSLGLSEAARARQKTAARVARFLPVGREYFID